MDHVVGLLAAGVLDAAGYVLEKTYQVVMVKEVVTLGRDFLVVIGLGHVIHVHRRRARRVARRRTRGGKR